MSILVENLTHIYMQGKKKKKTAIKKVNLEIESGEILAIVGRTGSGKSTLIQHLNGLLKPTAGKVFINGIGVSQKEFMKVNNKVGLVFQYPEHQFFEETVFKDISFGPLKMGVLKEEAEQRVYKSIKDVGLDNEILKKSPFAISGGEKRKVAIAGIIAINPEILILDEPTVGLDPQGRRDIIDLLDRLRKERKITIIIVSHNMNDVFALAERIVIIDKGEIKLDRKTNNMFDYLDSFQEFGLLIPPVVRLLKKLSNVIPEINIRVKSIKDAKHEILKYLEG